MAHHAPSDMVIDAESRVRANTSRDGFVAGLLIFLGFFVIGGAVGTPTYVKSVEVLRVAMQVGGLLMVGVTIWSAVGSPIAMLLDSIVCGLLGVTLMVCAIMFMAASAWIPGVGGVMGGVSLLVSCYHLSRDYRLLPEDDDLEDSEENSDSNSTSRIIRERSQAIDSVQPGRAGVHRPRGDFVSIDERPTRAALRTNGERDQARGR